MEYRCKYGPCKIKFIINGLPKLKVKTLCCPICQGEVEEAK